METLVANIGGYIGLFLGYAILQIPVSVGHIMNAIKSMITRKVDSCSESERSHSNSIPENTRPIIDKKPFVSSSAWRNEDITKIKQSVKDVENILTSIKQNIQKIDPELENDIQ